MKQKMTCPSGVVGWREWIFLPAMTDIPIKAKVDTGAKTSALHAWNIRSLTIDEQDWVEFELHPDQKSNKRIVKCRAPVHTRKSVKSSNGKSEVRFSIMTDLRIGSMTYSSEITLTNRDEMGFRMLLGRSALKNRFLVECGHSFVQGRQDNKE